MKRGIIEVSHAEVDEILKRVSPAVYEGTPLESKLNAIMISDVDPVNLEISAEELEVILDEIAIPDPANDTEDIKSIRRKIQQKILEFHGNGE
ncbi:MAG: hypothetical protein QY318_03855 [Candidatus Dojkabacteria bacterium]|nr:MAG: hypothetical protein QY318_03855 [Candidatus Dojkabacteria bacterium]